MKKEMWKFKQAGDSRYIYERKIDKVYLQYGIFYGGFKNLTRKTAPDKVLHNEAFRIVKNQKYERYQRSLVLIL